MHTKYYCVSCYRQNKAPSALSKNEPCKCGCFVIEDQRAVQSRLMKRLGDITNKHFHEEKPYSGEDDEEKKEIIKHLEKLTGKTI